MESLEQVDPPPPQPVPLLNPIAEEELVELFEGGNRGEDGSLLKLPLPSSSPSSSSKEFSNDPLPPPDLPEEPDPLLLDRYIIARLLQREESKRGRKEGKE